MSRTCEEVCQKIRSENVNLQLASCNYHLIFSTSTKFYLRFTLVIFILCLPKISYSQVNFWQQSSNGFDGGAISALAIDSRNNTVYIGTGGGVLRSTDNGASWKLVNSGLTNTGVGALAVDANNYLFAGTTGGGVFRSTDGGTHWKQVNSGLTVRNVWSIAISPTGEIFAGTEGGHVLSPNGEQIWKSYLSTLEEEKRLDSIYRAELRRSPGIQERLNRLWLSGAPATSAAEPTSASKATAVADRHTRECRLCRGSGMKADGDGCGRCNGRGWIEIKTR